MGLNINRAAASFAVLIFLGTLGGTARAIEGSQPVGAAVHKAITPVAGEPVDVAPFGEFRTWDVGKDIGVLWEDNRDIFKVIVRFTVGEKIPDPSAVRLQYWESRWPESRIPRNKVSGSGGSGWVNQGDWFQGRWKDADAQIQVVTANVLAAPVGGPFAAVPQGHWAYAAVAEILNGGLIESPHYDARTNCRFEFAMCIGQTMPKIGRKTGAQPDQRLADACTTMSKLITEFSYELTGCGLDTDKYLEDLAELRRRNTASDAGSATDTPQRISYGKRTALTDDGPTWTYTFNPVSSVEFPNQEGYNATYRTTMKLRLLFADKTPSITGLQAFTDSTWQKAEAVIESDRSDASDISDRTVEVFNGRIDRVLPKAGGVALSFWYAKPVAVISFDETIVTVRRKEHSFSFAAKDIVDGKRIFIRDYGVLIKPASDTVTYAQMEEAYQKGSRTIYDRVAAMPEQTLERTWNSMPQKKRIYMPLAVEGGRQHFGIEPNGDIRLSRTAQNRVQGRDNPRVQWKGESMYVRFDLDQGSAATGASIEDSVLPIANTWYEKRGVRYSQDAFATPLSGKLGPDGRIKGDDPQALLIRFRLTNLTDKPLTATIPISSTIPSGKQTLSEKDGLIYAKQQTGDALRLYVDTNGVAKLTANEKSVMCRVDLPARGIRDVFAKISFETLDTPEDITQLKSLNYEQQHKMIAEHWRKRVAQSCRIITPEPMINEFYASNITHQLINTENEVGAPERGMAKVGTFIYGVYGNESTMMLTEMDRRGFPEISDKMFRSWVHYQGTAPLPGDYTTADGVFQGVGQYAEKGGGYNQNHGWALWGMAEHYRFTGDVAWLDRMAPSIVKACDWIVDQRARTRTDECVGIRSIERGLMPPGQLEDIEDWRSWMSNNTYSYWGLRNAAEILAERGHPDAPRLLKDADDYEKDIVAAFTEAMLRSPVVPLRDGTWVPTMPSEVHRRGRSFGWINETLEGSIHMIRCGLVDPNSQLAEWIMKDYEDNRYISDEFGYQTPFFDRDWFSIGGFSQQPSLLCSPTPYLMRDDIKHYLRSYFNAFAAGYFPERAMLTEHPLPKLGDFFGDHFKTSDEAMNTSWLRWMFVWDEDKDLHLGKAIPRYWLADGQQISIERAQTHFGQMSMSMKSRAAKGSIEMTIDPPTRRPPGAVYARFRHPEGKGMNRVTVNGKAWDRFDAAKEWVVLPPLAKKTVVVAYYE